MEVLVNIIYVRFVIDLNKIIDVRCYEYIKQSQNIPSVRYQIMVKKSGKTSEFTPFPPLSKKYEAGNWYLLTFYYAFSHIQL